MEMLTERERQIRNISKVAAKWWANVLDGRAKQDFGLPEGEELVELAEDKPEIKHEIAVLKALLIQNTLDHAVPRYKRDAFEVKLAELIEKDIKETGCAYLYVEEGEVEGRLGLAAYYCGIDHSAHSAFPCDTEMFVLPDKIELKYGKTDIMRVVHDVNDRKNSILLKEAQGRDGK